MNMSDTIEVLKSNGLVNAASIVKAALKTGVPLPVAAAFVSQESGGKNIYGHDAGGVNTVRGNLEVTEANYASFYDQVVNKKRTSNGVGPLQITYPGYFPQATKQGYRLWDPTDNIAFGLNIIKASLNGDYSDSAINRAAQRYNSGSPTGAPSYGANVVRLYHKWTQLLKNATPAANVFPLNTSDFYGVNDRTSRSHSGLNAVDAQNVKRIQSKLGVASDGRFGPNTESAIKKFQSSKHLAVDGKVGPLTWVRLMGS